MLNKLLSRLVTHNGTPIRKASRHVSCIDMDRPDRLPSAHLKSGHRFGWRQGILPGGGRFLILFFLFLASFPLPVLHCVNCRRVNINTGYAVSRLANFQHLDVSTALLILPTRPRRHRMIIRLIRVVLLHYAFPEIHGWHHPRPDP